MNDFETELYALTREAPSPELDGRMVAAFAQAKQDAARRRLTPWLWWCGATVGLAAAAAVALVVTRPAATTLRGPETTVYRIEAPAPMRALLLEPGRAERTPPRVVVRVSTF